MKPGVFLAAFVVLAVFLAGSFGRALAAEAGAARMAQLRIKPGQLEAFKAAVREEMRDALRLEPGVVALYAVADKKDPNKITFFELYMNEEAYQAHRETPHFKKYFEATKDMIVERVLLEAVPMELRDRRNTPLEK